MLIAGFTAAQYVHVVEVRNGSTFPVSGASWATTAILSDSAEVLAVPRLSPLCQMYGPAVRRKAER
jgi:hypothetical protein